MAEILEAAPAAAPDALEFNTTFQGQKLVLRVKRDGVVADLKAAITGRNASPGEAPEVNRPGQRRPAAGRIKARRVGRT